MGIGPADQATPATQATVAPRNWQEMLNALHGSVEEFAGRLRTETRRNTRVGEDLDRFFNRVTTLNTNCERFEAGLRAVRTQVRNLQPGGGSVGSAEQVQAVVRRELI